MRVILKRPALTEAAQHLHEGLKGRTCLVCHLAMKEPVTTSLYGQIVCERCGCSYQIMGIKPSDRNLQAMGLLPQSVAPRFCDVYELLPVLQAYWSDTHQRLPMGLYDKKTEPRHSEKESDDFSKWLWEHREDLKEQYEDLIDWNGLRFTYEKGTKLG